MGSFEKLGILVIVVIIVMILAVAIYQWGGTEGPNEWRGALDGPTPPLSVLTKKPAGARNVDYIRREEERKRLEAERRNSSSASGVASGPAWPGGIPKSYTIKKGDVVWNLVIKDWRLKEGFTGAIARANPELNMMRLRPGKRIRIPNPDAYRSGSKSSARSAQPVGHPKRKIPRGARIIEVQEGDSFSTIAYEQLGRASRMDEIMALNPGVKPKNLRPGQKLIIPAR